jgi:hypothetical protein
VIMEDYDKDTAYVVLYKRLRPQIRKIAQNMEEKFRLNDEDRGDPFRPTSFDFLLKRLGNEWVEFMLAMGKGSEPRRPPSEVWKEAADICNFITMMAENYEREWVKGVKKK